MRGVFGQNRNSWRYSPIRMRGVFQSGTGALAGSTNLNSRCSSVGTKIPGDISQHKWEVFGGQHKCEASFGQVRSSWRYFPVYMRGVVRSEPKFLAIFPNLNAGRFSVRTGTPGDFFQFKCEVCVGQNQSSQQYVPVLMRGVCRSGPKFLAVFTDLHARSFSVRTEVLRSSYHCEC